MPKNLIAFCGSEISATISKNINLKEGTWKDHPLGLCASKEGWTANKKLVLDFYKERFETIKATEPLEIHKALASLQKKYSTVCITPTIDDFLERAGCEEVIHLRGSNINYCMCEWHPCTTDIGCHMIEELECNKEYCCTYYDLHPSPIELGEMCPKCGEGQLRPAIIWQDEVSPNYEIDLSKMAKFTQVLLCIGNVLGLLPQAFLEIPTKILVLQNEANNPKLRASWQIHVGDLNKIGTKVIQNL